MPQTVAEHRADCLAALHTYKRLIGRAPNDTYLDLALWNVIERTLTDRNLAISDHQGWHAVSEARHIQSAHARDGLPAFRVTHSLGAALLLTENRMFTKDIHFPFGCFMVELPGPDSPLVLTSPSGPPEDIVRMWVHDTEMVVEPEETDALSQAVFPLLSKLAGLTTPEEAGLVLRDLEPRLAHALETIKRERVLSILIESTQGAPFMITTSVPGATGDVVIEDWLQALKGSKLGTLERAREADLAMILRLILNLVAYATKHEDGATSMAAHARPVRASPARPPEGPAVEPRVWLLGNEIKLPKHVREMVRLASSEGKQKAPWHVSKRFIVKGHMRNQAYGPRRSLRRLRWIQPFWKGPEDVSVALIRQYMVDEEGGHEA